MEVDKETTLLVIEMLMHLTKTITPVVEHQGTLTGDILAEVAQNALAMTLDMAIAAHAHPPQEAFEILSKWGVCVPTDQHGMSETIQAVINGDNKPHPCTVIHEHKHYSLTCCARNNQDRMTFCLVNRKTGEGIAEDIMPKMLEDLICDLEDGLSV